MIADNSAVKAIVFISIVVDGSPLWLRVRIARSARSGLNDRLFSADTIETSAVISLFYSHLFRVRDRL